MNIKEILTKILNYSNEISIYCYYQTSKSNKKILYNLIQTGMINVCTKCSINENLCVMTAEYGYLNILKWAFKNGYSLHKDICDVAVINGHLKILKWARKMSIGSIEMATM